MLENDFPNSNHLLYFVLYCIQQREKTAAEEEEEEAEEEEKTALSNCSPKPTRALTQS